MIELSSAGGASIRQLIRRETVFVEQWVHCSNCPSQLHFWITFFVSKNLLKQHYASRKYHLTTVILHQYDTLQWTFFDIHGVLFIEQKLALSFLYPYFFYKNPSSAKCIDKMKNPLYWTIDKTGFLSVSIALFTL